MSPTAFLRVTNVGKTYAKSWALKRISMEVELGERVVLFGPSGCGKTTLLRLIAGLEIPDEGDIWIDGRQAAGPARSLIAPHNRGVGFVFQDFALWPHMTVAQSLEFVVSSARLARGEQPAHVKAALALSRAESFANRYPRQLSGGEQQRAALARAIVAKPKLLLLDEPFSSLDQRLREDLRRDVVLLQNALQITMVAVTHDSADADVLGNRIIRMNAML